MADNHWASRVSGPQGLHEVRSAARDLSQQAQRNLTATGVVFQNVAQVVLIGTALISGAAGLVHLWKALEHPSHAMRGGRKEARPHDPNPDSSSQRPARAEHQKAVHAPKEVNSAEIGHRWR